MYMYIYTYIYINSSIHLYLSIVLSIYRSIYLYWVYQNEGSRLGKGRRTVRVQNVASRARVDRVRRGMHMAMIPFVTEPFDPIP